MKAMDRGYDLRVFEDSLSLDRAAADLVVDLSRDAVALRERFTVALSGGSTPRGLYGLLASPPYRDLIDWKATHVFWADERCVPPQHEDSNYRLASDLLLSKVPLARAHVHRMHGESDPAAAAASYDKELGSFFGGGPFTFDLVLLGLGTDGHTASLFPGESATCETGRLAVSVPAEGRRERRITLTLPAINRARAVLFLVAGAGKATAVKNLLQAGNVSNYPAALVRPERGSLSLYLDGEAAGLLTASS